MLMLLLCEFYGESLSHKAHYTAQRKIMDSWAEQHLKKEEIFFDKTLGCTAA